MFLNCICWCTYGIVISDFAMITPNSIGLFLSCYYIWLCSDIIDKNIVIRKSAITLITYILSIGAIYILSNSKSQLNFNLGILCSTLSVIMFGSPLIQIQNVIKEGNSESIILPLAITSMLCSFFWSTYGFLISNNFVLVPNTIGFILSMVQLTVKFSYPSNPVALSPVDSNV